MRGGLAAQVTCTHLNSKASAFAAHMVCMTTFSEQDVRRDAGGRFGAHERTSPEVVLPHGEVTAPYFDETESAVLSVMHSAERTERKLLSTKDLGRAVGGFGSRKRAVAALEHLHAEGAIEPLPDGRFRVTALGGEYVRQSEESAWGRRRTITTINPEG